MKDKEIKKEEPDYTGQEFLLKNDKKHLDLLAELNEKIKLYDDNTEVEYKEDLIKFINDHYKTFIARLQAGLPFLTLRGLLMEWGSYSSYYIHCPVLHDHLKFIDEAKNRGLIFAICCNDEGTEMMYIIDPKKEWKKTIESIKKVNNNVKNIKVIAPGKNMVEDALEKLMNGSYDGNDLTLLPINEVCFSCISSRQTKAVENCCKVINCFTKKEAGEEKLKVELEGTSQGVDFITKMVGSTHGRKQTRIKNADINLHIVSPHLFQDPQKIVERLKRTDESNTFNTIDVENSESNWLHPECKENDLKKWLNYYKQKGWIKVDNSVSSTNTSSSQQHTLN